MKYRDITLFFFLKRRYTSIDVTLRHIYMPFETSAIGRIQRLSERVAIPPGVIAVLWSLLKVGK